MASNVDQRNDRNGNHTKGAPLGSAGLILAVACVIVAGGAGHVQAQQHFGLFTGIDRYDPDYGPEDLPSCVNDATDFMNALLRDASRWNANNATLLTDTQATKQAIVQSLRMMAQAAGPDDVCVYFQSSHGGQYVGRDAYLCMHDADLSDTELGAELSSFHNQTKVIVVVDACFSGGLFKAESGAKERSEPSSWLFAQNAMAAFQKAKAARAKANGDEIPKDLGNNIAFITAADYNETAQAGNPYSLFAGHMINAFRIADADANGDQQHSFGELYDWAAPLATQENPAQTAQAFNLGLLEATIAAGVSGIDVPPPGDDPFEENDAANQAATIQSGTFQLQGQDEDWFVIRIDRETELSAEINGPQGDLDVFLVDPDMNVVVQSVNEGTADAIRATAPAGEWYLLVAPYEGMTSSYTLTLAIDGDNGPTGDDRFEENDSAEQAGAIEPGVHELQGADEDWFVIRVDCETEVSAEINGPQGDLDVFLVDSDQNLVAQSVNEGTVDAIRATVPAGEWFLLVAPYEGMTSSYTLTLATEENDGSIGDDPFEESYPAGHAGAISPPPLGPCNLGGPAGMIGTMLGLMGLTPLRRRRW
jgi:hypothetical protein